MRILEADTWDDVWRSLDLLLCMHAYRDLRYGSKVSKKVAKLRRRMKLAWIAYNMYVAQKLLDNWSQLENGLWKWYESKGHMYRDEETYREFINFIHGYLQTTVAKLATLYVYLYLKSPIMPNSDKTLQCQVYPDLDTCGLQYLSPWLLRNTRLS